MKNHRFVHEKSNETYENILTYDISYKTFMCSVPLHIWFMIE